MLEMLIVILLLAVIIKSGIWLLILPFSLIGLLFRPFGMWHHHGLWHHRPPMGPGPGPMGHGFGPGPMGPRW